MGRCATDAREIATVVGGFSAALALARASDLVATIPERHTGNLFVGMYSFALPLPIAQFTVSMLWHPRSDGDPAHRWLRGCVRDACAAQLPVQAAPESGSGCRTPPTYSTTSAPSMTCR